MDWITYLFNNQPDWDETNFISYEKKLGIKFPNLYKEIISKQQGCIPKRGIIKYFDGIKQNLTSMGPLFHFVENDPALLSFRLNAYANSPDVVGLEDWLFRAALSLFQAG